MFGIMIIKNINLLLKADEWYISVKRNQLHVTFKVRYKED